MNAAPDAMITIVRSPIPITPKMLEAGRAAFIQKRSQLNDLTHFFDCDLVAFLSRIYREMRRAAAD